MSSRLKKTALYTVVAALGMGAAYFLNLSAEFTWSYHYWRTPKPAPLSTLSAPLPPCPDCNVILISLDTLRADHLGFISRGPSLTPNFDKIAAQSVVFTHAYTNAFFTTPSHMTLFTSLYATTHQVQGDDMKLMRNKRTEVQGHALDAKYTTLAEILKKNGYQTIWDGPLRFKFLEMSDGFGRGFDIFNPSPFDRGLDFGPERDGGFVTKSLAPLRGARHKTFLFLHSYLTHHPYLWRSAPAEWPASNIAYNKTALLEQFAGTVAQDPGNLPHMLGKFPMSTETESRLVDACIDYKNMGPCLTKYSSPDRFWHAVGQMQVHQATNLFHNPRRSPERVKNEMAIYREAYARGVKNMDRELGQLWAGLQQTGALDHTLIVFVSDHGEELFENGEGSHSSFYEHTAHVPIVIYHPKMTEHPRVDQLVSLIDVLPTILSTLSIPAPPQVQGRPPWQNKSEYVFGYSLGNDYVRSQEWKLIRNYSGVEELYFLPLDPGEHQNLISLHNPWTTSAYARLSEARKNWLLE